LNGAQRLGEEVLAVRARLLGEEHPDTLNSKRRLAQTLWAQGDLPDVRRLEEEVLAACLRLFGEEHRDTRAARSNLARTLRAQGDLDDARRLQEDAIAPGTGPLDDGEAGTSP
jgi:ATP/maltotriose-dependent transcriptional regulator MalT